MCFLRFWKKSNKYTVAGNREHTEINNINSVKSHPFAGNPTVERKMG